MAKKIPADATQPVTEFQVKSGMKLEEIQRWVGGYIEIVTLNPMKPESPFFVINEEGKLLGLPLNERATRIWAEYYGGQIPDYIAGDAVLLTTEEADRVLG